ncbi:MAG TPA: tripartite tricarboxylate transporter substrate-binding protein [Burkholderiales bacterium]|nr:tripartite tricarboxylate transporter substrate-binding protein [Burkholderiales bacterium]
MKRLQNVATLMLATLVVPGMACAQNFPTRAIRILTVQAGGSSDLPARIIAKEFQSSLGQPAVVENRGIIGVEIVAQAPPDGHTLVHYTSPLWIIPLFRSASWDAARDFVPITITIATPNVLVVHPSVPVKSVQELIALAKARPGVLNYASTSTGSANHLSAELFKSMAGLDIVRIAFKGAGSALNSLLAGELHLMFATAGSIPGHVKAGKLRPLAVASAQPTALAPGMPTMASAGLPGYESISYTAFFAPAKTPAAIVNRLSQEAASALRVPEVKERLFNTGVEVVANTPQDAAAMITSETERVRKMIAAAGLREQ